MKSRDLIIICRSRDVTIDSPKTGLTGLLVWGSHIKQMYLGAHISRQASPREIKARIDANVAMPEWIGSHRFGIFDLLNYVKNGRRYVYDPGASTEFFDPIGIPSSTSLYLYDYLLRNGYNPLNIDNFAADRAGLRRALENNPRAVAISATFLDAATIKGITNYIRAVNTSVPVVVGGSILLTKLDSSGRLEAEYEDLLSDGVYVILEENGLDTFGSLLEQDLAGGPPESIPNIVYRRNGAIRYTERQPVHDDLDAGYPNWANVGEIAKGVAFIRASQGCPFKCKFCTFPKASPRFRQRSVASIRDELRHIRAAGIKNITFTDDHFATGPSRITEICKMMLEERFDFNWFAGIRAGSITEDNARLLQETGCKVLCVGLESGDDRILGLMNKRSSAASNMECLEILDRHDITAYGSFIVGFPGETDETLDNTIRWINSSPLKLYKAFLFYLLPGSIIYDEQEEHNISFMGDRYDYRLWTTPTMDALRASELLREFILRVEKAALIYSYSPMYAFFPLLSRGYTMSESLNLLRIQTDLVKSELSNRSILSKRRFRRTKLDEIARLLK